MVTVTFGPSRASVTQPVAVVADVPADHAFGGVEQDRLLERAAGRA